jgi:SSS family solute:Na+ symporter
MYDVPEGTAYAVLYTVLCGFTLLAILASGYCGTSKILVKLGCIMRPVAPTEEMVVKQTKTADFFLAARNSAGAR